MHDIQPFAGPVLVTVAYTVIYYAIMGYGARVKYRLLAEYRERGETFDRYFGQDREMLAADRMQLNMLEHMPLFLVLLWLNAVFVGPTWATAVGGVFTLARAAYPFALGARVGRMQRMTVFAATGPGYLAIGALMGALVWRLLA